MFFLLFTAQQIFVCLLGPGSMAGGDPADESGKHEKALRYGRKRCQRLKINDANAQMGRKAVGSQTKPPVVTSRVSARMT